MTISGTIAIICLAAILGLGLAGGLLLMMLDKYIDKTRSSKH